MKRHEYGSICWELKTKRGVSKMEQHYRWLSCWLPQTQKKILNKTTPWRFLPPPNTTKAERGLQPKSKGTTPIRAIFKGSNGFERCGWLSQCTRNKLSQLLLAHRDEHVIPKQSHRVFWGRTMFSRPRRAKDPKPGTSSDSGAKRAAPPNRLTRVQEKKSRIGSHREPPLKQRTESASH